MGVIAIEGIEVYGHHGVYPKEREQGNLYVIDIYLDVAIEKAGGSDSLDDTLDYFKVYQSIIKLMQEPVNLLEHLVEKIGRQIINQFALVRQVRVKVSKQRPFAMEACKRTYVEQIFGTETP